MTVSAPGGPKTADELKWMRVAASIVCEILDALEAAAKPGVTTLELDRLAEQLTKVKGAKPAFKGYHGFPGSLCTSVNDEVVHGIPSKRALTEGDLLKLDFGVSYQGLFADSARTVRIGTVTDEANALIDATREALAVGIAACVPGNRVGDVGHAIQRHVEAKGFSVVRDFSGHGVGRALHEPPSIPNHGTPGTGMPLKAGMTLALEPMVNAGTEKIELLDDEWTTLTLDRRLSAHFEHTILVTEGAPEILTRRSEAL